MKAQIVMAQIPRWLKRPILPVWNAGHRLAYRAGLYVSAVRHGRFESCVVCGRFTPMLYQRRVIPDRLAELWGISPRLAEALARKESCDCAWCGANLRARRIARVLLECFPGAESARVVKSVAEWVALPEVQRLRVAEINRIGGLHEQLRRLPCFSRSEFVPGVPSGSMVGGIRSEDLTRLSYHDGAFDLVLTSETLEHVPNVDAALGEIARVLVAGGIHLFTVPVLPGVPNTFQRASVRADGTLSHHAPLIHHPGGDVGYLVFTEFGADLTELVGRSGFDLEVRYGPITEDDLAQVYIARKR